MIGKKGTEPVRKRSGRGWNARPDFIYCI